MAVHNPSPQEPVEATAPTESVRKETELDTALAEDIAAARCIVAGCIVAVRCTVAARTVAARTVLVRCIAADWVGAGCIAGVDRRAVGRGLCSRTESEQLLDHIGWEWFGPELPSRELAEPDKQGLAFVHSDHQDSATD